MGGRLLDILNNDYSVQDSFVYRDRGSNAGIGRPLVGIDKPAVP